MPPFRKHPAFAKGLADGRPISVPPFSPFINCKRWDMRYLQFIDSPSFLEGFNFKSAKGPGQNHERVLEVYWTGTGSSSRVTGKNCRIVFPTDQINRSCKSRISSRVKSRPARCKCEAAPAYATMQGGQRERGLTT